ncbi:MAG: SPOR domain-containing protein [Allosphingosinicella sp.]
MTDEARVDGMGDEDRLPWLEAVEEDEERGGPSVAKLIGAIVIGLVAIGIIVGGLFWLGNRSREGGDGDVIAAPEGDYKVRPDQPGGMNVAGEGDTAYAASEGAEPKGRLNTETVPQTPVARPPAQPVPAPATKAPAQPRPPVARPAPAPAAPAAPAARGSTIQLGAFSSQASANRAWTALSGRFRYLAPLGHSIVPVQSGGRTLYRLRASGSDAAGVCRRLQIAGEACNVVN